MVCTHEASLTFHTRTVLSCEQVRARSSVGCSSAPLTFLLWPLNSATTLPCARSSSTAFLSPPAVSTRLSLVACRSSAVMVELDECRPGKDWVLVKALMSSAVASSAALVRFFRPLDRVLEVLVMLSATAALMPDWPPSTSMAPSAPPPAAAAPAAAPCACSAAKAWRAWSRSRVSRAITRQAASCWYSACESSWRTLSTCCRSLNVSSIVASHSSWKSLSKPGTLVAAGMRGRTNLGVLSSTSWSTVSGSPFTGSVSLLARCFSISLRSNTAPDTGDTTATSGTSPLKAQVRDISSGARCSTTAGWKKRTEKEDMSRLLLLQTDDDAACLAKLQTRLAAVGASEAGRWRVDLDMRAFQLASQWRRLVIFKFSDKEDLRFAICETADVTQLSQNVEHIFEVMGGLLKTKRKLAIEGLQHSLGDLRVRVGTLVTHLNKGVVLELEFAPCVYDTSCSALLQEALHTLVDDPQFRTLPQFTYPDSLGDVFGPRHRAFQYFQVLHEKKIV
eukprot:m.26639 g.26639  ORF g.26639 m.26639 type:complete len:506 (-) comp11546_c0_seq1:37-1554(-)